MNNTWPKVCRTQRSDLISVLVTTGFLLAGSWQLRPALGQACITCRTEKCPTKEGMHDWCGSGADPTAAATPKQRSQSPGAARKRNLLDVRIESEPTGASIQVDGQPLPAPAPLQTLLGKGWHRVEATLDGYSPTTVNANLLQRGQEIRVRLQRIAAEEKTSPVPSPPVAETTTALGNTPTGVSPGLANPAPDRADDNIPAAPRGVDSVPAPPKSELKAPGRNLLIGGGILAGLGLIGVGAGAGLYTADAANHSDFAASTNELDKQAFLQRAQVFSTASIASYAVGAAALTGGAVMLITGAIMKSRSKTIESKRQSLLLPSRVGLLVTLVGEY